MGQSSRPGPHRTLGPLPARALSHHGLLPQRVYHRRDRQEHEGPAQPRTDAVQAVANAGSHGADQQIAPSRSAATATAAVYESAAKNLFWFADCHHTPDV